MNKYVMDDDFLYKYIKSAENIMIDSLPVSGIIKTMQCGS